MNKKGFTLIELIAVITILGIIALIIIPSMNGIRKEGKIISYKQALDTVENAAKNYVISVTINNYFETKNSIMLSDLTKENLIDSLVVNGKSCLSSTRDGIIYRKEKTLDNSPNKKYNYNILIICGEDDNLDYYAKEVDADGKVHYYVNDDIPEFDSNTMNRASSYECNGYSVFTYCTSVPTNADKRIFYRSES